MNRLFAAAVSFVSSFVFAAPLQTEAINAGPGGFLVTSTLITGEKEAVLVDAQFTLSDAHRVAAKVLESGKTLTTVFITHAHPDHYFGLEVFKAQFPGVKIIAAPKVVEEAKATGAGKLGYWKPIIGANLTSSVVVPTAFTANSFELEGQKIELITIDNGESDAATALFIPSTSTLIAGDAIYEGVHSWLADANTQARRETWLKNLAALKALNPKTVIGGHRAPDAKSGAGVIDEESAYLRDFSAAVAKSKTPEALVSAVNAKYSALQLPIILDLASKASVPAKK